LPGILGSSNRLQQVFLNLFLNAKDAMPSGGMLEVRSSANNGTVEVEISDTGMGIQRENLARVFDPFFTTKATGRGTGLGLSVSYGIIKEHGGDISARNPPEGGAIIEIRLPSAGKAVTPAAKPAPRREVLIEGTVLLVDDEEAVIEFERDVLAGAGAQVVTLMNWDEVKLRLLNQQFDAVIMNGKMPGGVSVQQVYEWISNNCPALKSHLLFTFSTLAEPDERTFLQENNIPHLVKPFEVGDLIAHARRMLQKTQAAVAG